ADGSGFLSRYVDAREIGERHFDRFGGRAERSVLVWSSLRDAPRGNGMGGDSPSGQKRTRRLPRRDDRGGIRGRPAEAAASNCPVRAWRAAKRANRRISIRLWKIHKGHAHWKSGLECEFFFSPNTIHPRRERLRTGFPTSQCDSARPATRSRC